MGTNELTPADKVIAAFGGVRETARIVGRSPSSVARWRLPKERSGTTGGRIPGNLQQKILDYAKEHGIKITAGDLIG